MKKVNQAAQKKNRKIKRRLFFSNIEQVFGFIFLIFTIVVTIWVTENIKNWMNNPDRAALSQIILNGDLRVTNEKDIRQVILDLGLLDTYTGQNVDDIQREIMRLPWIKKVRVRKQWPDKLMVSIVEYKPAFYWNDLFLLDDEGNLFNIPADRIVNLQLPRLYGPENKEKSIVETYNRLNNIYKEQISGQFSLTVSAAIIDERNAWQLLVKPCVLNKCDKNWNMKLLLGSKKIEERYQKFIKLFPEIQRKTDTNQQIMVADLRYENGISVQKNNKIAVVKLR